MLSDSDLRLVRRATDLADQLDGHDDHTVTSAAYDEDGELVTGVNSHHFTGGPCAELVLLGNAAERRSPVRLRTITAVLSGARAVIPPCGRCRQVLFDYHRATRVIVHGRNGLEAVAVEDLLPYAFDQRVYWPDGPGRAVYFAERYLPAVRAGDKRTTIRVHDPMSPGPVRLVFEHAAGAATQLAATVTEVRPARAGDLTDEDARLDGFTSRDALLDALTHHYPEAGPDTEVEIVSFQTDSASES